MQNVAISPRTIHHHRINRQVVPENLPEHLELRDFSLDEYHRLVEMEFFTKDDQVELLEGLLIRMSPTRPVHASTVDLLTEIFIEQLGRKVKVRPQQPVTLRGAESEPEPDVVIAERKLYRDHHPSGAEIRLLIEVSDATLAKDRTIKGSIYARENVQEYWIINLVDNVLEVYRDPQVSLDGEATYRTKLTLDREQQVSPVAFPKCKIDLQEIIP